MTFERDWNFKTPNRMATTKDVEKALGENSPEGLAVIDADPGSLFRLQQDARLAATYAPRGLALQPAPLQGVSTTSASTLVPLETHDGFLWAADGSTLKKSSDGTAWTTVTTLPSSPSRILWTSDGEVLLVSGNISKSSGWSTNPATATWSTVLTKSAPAGPGVPASHIDGDGTKFIAAEYSSADRSESRYVWVSTNSGSTWTVVYDDRVSDPTGLLSHRHGVCYDPWEDRFWRSEGHGTEMGLYHSTDNGASWTKLGGTLQPDAAPFALCATDDGIVCGSDSNLGGVYGIARAVDPTEMEMRWLARWRTAVDGVIGLASRAHRDPDTGIVWLTFQSDNAAVAPATAGGTARAAAFVYTYPTVGVRRAPAAVGFNDRLFWSVQTSATYDLIVGRVDAPGVAAGADEGNTGGGSTPWQTSMAAGRGASASARGSVAVGATAVTSAESAVALGYLAAAAARGVSVGRGATGAADGISIGYTAVGSGPNQVVVGTTATAAAACTSAVVIGYAATATVGTGITAIGAGASVNNNNGTAIGHDAASFTQGVAIGRLAATTGTSGVAVGMSASAAGNAVAVGQSAVGSGLQSVAIGQGATATATNAVAVGYSADATSGTAVALGMSTTASHADGVALGTDSTTTAANQVQIDDRHIEARELSADPAAPAADKARWYVKDNGAGKSQLCVRFATGAVQVIATEP